MRAKPRVLWLSVFAVILTVGGAPLTAPARGASGAPEERPREILSWRHQILSGEEYKKVAGEWAAYVGRHPKDARAWVAWGNALRYSGNYSEAKEKYARALAADSTDVGAATAVAGTMVVESGADDLWRQAHGRLLRIRARDPGYAPLYYSLWITSLRAGDEDLAHECLRKMVELGDMPRPLLDYGANMVLGAPPNAIVFTNGDNDTYPPLAFQTMTGLRPDVSVVNLSLLNTVWYLNYWKAHGLPITWTDAVMDTLRPSATAGLPADQAQRHIARNLAASGWPRPLFYAVTVVADRRVLPGKCRVEGLLGRIPPETAGAEGKEAAEKGGGPEKVSPEEGVEGDDWCDWDKTRDLLDTVYALDSATDPLVDWARENSVARGMRNYSHLLEGLGRHLLSAGQAEQAGPYLYRAVRLMAFHGQTEAAGHLWDEWSKASPGGRLLAPAKELLSSGR